MFRSRGFNSGRRLHLQVWYSVFYMHQYEQSYSLPLARLFIVIYVKHTLPSCKEIQLGAQFCVVYLFLFSTCFGQTCAHRQEKLLYLCDTGTCHSVWVASGLLVGVSLQPTDQPLTQSDKCQCRIDRVISHNDGHMVARNM
jgi:hypothetical protein